MLFLANPKNSSLKKRSNVLRHMKQNSLQFEFWTVLQIHSANVWPLPFFTPEVVFTMLGKSLNRRFRRADRVSSFDVQY